MTDVAVAADEFRIPYALTIYRAVDQAPHPGMEFYGRYYVAGGVALAIYGGSAEDVAAKARAQNEADVARHVAMLGGAEATRERMAAAREARARKAKVEK